MASRIYNTATYQFPEEERISTVLENATEEYSKVLTREKLVKGSALKIDNL